MNCSKNKNNFCFEETILKKEQIKQTNINNFIYTFVEREKMYKNKKALKTSWHWDVQQIVLIHFFNSKLCLHFLLFFCKGIIHKWRHGLEGYGSKILQKWKCGLELKIVAIEERDNFVKIAWRNLKMTPQ
jgi:hypothetical protein